MPQKRRKEGDMKVTASDIEKNGKNGYLIEGNYIYRLSLGHEYFAGYTIHRVLLGSGLCKEWLNLMNN